MRRSFSGKLWMFRDGRTPSPGWAGWGDGLYLSTAGGGKQGEGGRSQLNRFMAASTPWERTHSTASAARSTAASMAFQSSPWSLPSTQSAMS